MTLLAVAAAGGIAAWALLGRGPSAPKPEDQLLDQFRKAAAGTVVTPHVFGGELRVDQSEGKLNVVAEALPAPVCVQVGWQLAREGTVVINGVLPQRISGAKLAELCSLDPKGATLLWAPGQQ